MFPSLGSKSEEDEENKRANHAGPLGQGVSSHKETAAPPEDCRDLSDATETIMGVFPTDPWHDRGSGRVQDDRENCQRSGAQNFRASQSHETEVSTGSEGGVC